TRRIRYANVLAPGGTEEQMRPDYAGGSIVNLMASIEVALSGRSAYPPLRDLAPAEITAARNVCLLVIDGLGSRCLAQLGDESALRRRLRASITSVFPSTAAPAITTVMARRAPQLPRLPRRDLSFPPHSPRRAA